MFWRVSGLNTASPVDSILDKERYSLEELLDEDELIQECKALNARLTGFLKQRSSVEALVRYLVEPAPAGADARRQFKFPFAACEVFCCEVEGIFNTLLEDDALLDAMFGILAAPRPLNSMLAGYFSRVVGSLLLRRTADIMGYLRRRQDLLPALVAHVDTTSIAEVLVRLAGADDQRASLPATHLAWLTDTPLLDDLLGALSPEQPAEAAANAAEVVAAIAQSSGSPLTHCLAARERLETLFARALAPGAGLATHALNVCIALLEQPEQAAHMQAQQQYYHQQQAAAGGDTAPSAQASVRAQAIRCAAASVGRLAAMLEGGAGAGRQPIATSYGAVLSPPAGAARLKAIELLAVVLRTGVPEAEAAVMGTRGVQVAMELLLRYPFNNALHRHVAGLLTSFEGGSDALRTFLVVDCGLPGWLAAVPEEVPQAEAAAAAPATPAAGGKEEAEPRAEPSTRPPLRAGYMGYVTYIANRLLEGAAAEPGGKLAKALAADDAWQAWVAGRLESRNALENVYAWQCGRPSMGDPTGGDGYPADMDFAGMASDAFSRDVYQRYGVYGNEGDEEEEAEGEGEGEEEGAAPAWAEGLGGGPGKLQPPSASALQALADASSSSSSDDENAPSSDSGGSSPRDGAPSSPGPGGDAVVVSPSAGGARGGGDLSDLMHDAVLLDYEAAEQLVALQRQLEGGLSISDGAAAGAAGSREPGAGGGEGEGPDEVDPGTEFNAFNYWRQPAQGVEAEEEGAL